MTDEQIELLKKFVEEKKYPTFYKGIVAVPNPGALSTFHDVLIRVVQVGIHEKEDEPVAWLEDGTWAALWNCEHDQFVVFQPEIKWWEK